jgi:hypothetical protein
VVARVVRDNLVDANGAAPGADIAHHRDRHGVKVELRHIPESGQYARCSPQ